MVHHLKAALRKKMLEKREALGNEGVAVMSRSIMGRLLSHERFQEAKTVAFYIPKGKEVDTRPMIERALEMGKEVLVPVTNHKIQFYRFRSFEDLKAGKFGILEPAKHDAPHNVPHLVVVPGVSFGLCMHRLGYGKGYYDDYLSRSPAYRIGICYDFQVVEKLPKHDKDERMDEIITDKRIITMI